MESTAAIELSSAHAPPEIHEMSEKIFLKFQRYLLYDNFKVYVIHITLNIVPNKDGFLVIH